MRLLLYNIRYGAGIGRRIHFPVPYSGYLKPTNGHFGKIIEFIKDADPDIVGLIEVDFGSYRVDRRNQAAAIAKALDHQVVYTSKYADGSMVSKLPLMTHQGNAVLTNRAIIEQRFHFFRNGVKRLVIEVELPEVTLFLVHLSLKYRHRQYQLGDLLRLIADCEKPVVVAGDFNAFWGKRELELFRAASGLISANAEGAFSYPSRFPIRELDFIFHSPEIHTRGFHLPQVKLSDHLPLLWDFDAGAMGAENTACRAAEGPEGALAVPSLH